jgi:hypothetical protein
MLVHGPPPYLGGIGLGVEAEADLPADPGAQLGKPLVVRRPGDRLVQRLVGEPGGVPVRGLGLPGHGRAYGMNVVFLAPHRRGTRDELLDKLPEVEQFG